MPSSLPLRGPEVRGLDLTLPPERLAAWRGRRPLKRWRYVGVYTPELMLCVGDAKIGPVPQRWWAIALPDGELRERTTFGSGGITFDGSSVRVATKGVQIDLRLEESPGIEIVSPINERGAYIWTRKQACVPVSGSVEIDGTRHAVDGNVGFIDDSAGYHARHTAWYWSAGVGTTVDGRRVGWNLVNGIHDDPFASERTLWIDGEPRTIGPVTFAEDLSEIESASGSGAQANGGIDLHFDEWSRREHSTNTLIMRSSYSQPFGVFSGTLPDGRELAKGYGVMESHDVRW